MKVSRPTEFMVRIADVGTNTCWGSYKKMTDRNAVRLTHKAARHMMRDFVTEQHAPEGMYWLACLILSSLNCPEQEILKDIKRVNEELDNGLYTLSLPEGAINE